MPRRQSTRFAIAVLLTVLGSPAVWAVRPISADEAPKARGPAAPRSEPGGRGSPGPRGPPGRNAGAADPLAARPDPRRRARPSRRPPRRAEAARGRAPGGGVPRAPLLRELLRPRGRATRAAVVKLANHPDVQWVSLDGTRRRFQATAQNAQVLMRSDQANAVGFTGAGQTVAVLDTGVDYTVAELGGGPFPNAKVIGGMDTADEDNDPMDCDGHGTSVSGVVAGPRGVAPGAKIVALKVFGSTDATNGDVQGHRVRLRHHPGDQLRDFPQGRVRDLGDQHEPRGRARLFRRPGLLRQLRARGGRRGGRRRRRRPARRRFLGQRNVSSTRSRRRPASPRPFPSARSTPCSPRRAGAGPAASTRTSRRTSSPASRTRTRTCRCSRRAPSGAP